jgi:hypothetical protein
MQLPLEIESNQMFYVISLLDSVGRWELKVLTFFKEKYKMRLGMKNHHQIAALWIRICMDPH